MPIRPATAQDLPAIKAIYDHEVLTGISTFATAPPGPDYWQVRLDSRAPGDHVYVADDGEGVLGYAYSSAYRPREAYARTRESSVYLHPEARGRGVGRSLYDVLLAAMRADGVRLAVAVVALPNDASRALHRACGFRSVGVLHDVGHKLGRWVDTELFELRLT
ncbi:GNAT family N-acetyltransferase [Nocardioides koreensis]|uniref:GNAT family N-acetyltransferase n=1 Tax=Nocardioides koreensis TaxID=433651 RepID=A0ABN2ZM03_9ACTN